MRLIPPLAMMWLSVLTGTGSPSRSPVSWFQIATLRAGELWAGRWAHISCFPGTIASQLTRSGIHHHAFACTL
ncbi:uncharacterized protein GGS25DRAFT_487050 [Hypoxylon fragiforme]|uniref:uncharacterized protein n=1 Tax=Hypoxylon fragiforme TaxID=63214 RepID=UPI0020C610BE|nr:uncharacterized protein GGS25DRAFT_487050 [Hypoxylon fragiforme]KAI2609993.1 hypothetical protein GGS25DRAFT_487050 [Hypoxylon fragiforme]